MRPLLTFLFATLVARAELSPDHYRRLQEEAPECLVLQVEKVETKVTQGKDGRQLEIKAVATVQEVVRSRAGRKAGETIRIAYDIVQPLIPMPGPAPTPLLEKGTRTKAYLRPGASPDEFTPAAYGQSFVKP